MAKWDLFLFSSRRFSKCLFNGGLCNVSVAIFTAMDQRHLKRLHFLSGPDRPAEELITSANVASATHDNNGGEAQVRGYFRDVWNQNNQIRQREGISLAGWSGRTNQRGNAEDGWGKIGRPYRISSRPLLQPCISVRERDSWMRQWRSADQWYTERRRTRAAASQQGAMALAAGASFSKVCRCWLKDYGHEGIILIINIDIE